MPIVRSEQRPDKRFSIFACVVAEQCGEPERRIGRILKSEVLGRRRVTLVVRRIKCTATTFLFKFHVINVLVGLSVELSFNLWNNRDECVSFPLESSA
jgi:hypothetical protein